MLASSQRSNSASRRSSSMRSGRSSLPSSQQISSSNLPVASSSALQSTRNIVSGTTSSAAGGRQSRYDIDHEYVNTNPTPLARTVSNVPISTMTATGLAALCYLLCIILILATGCPFSRSVTFLFVYLLLGLVALASMAGLNMIFPHYRFNCMSLSVSLLYSGTAALIVSSLADSAFYGLCWQDPSSSSSGSGASEEPAGSTTPASRLAVGEVDSGKAMLLRVYEGCASGPGLFQSGVTVNYFLWFLALVGLAFQVVAHYFYG